MAHRQMRSALVLPALLALAGCATAPQDDLLASTPIVREMWREWGSVVHAARFSRLTPGDAMPTEWQPWGLQSGRRPTAYRLVDSTHGTVLEAFADRASTGLYRKIRISPQRQPILEWEWRLERRIPAAGMRVSPLDESPARLVISFHGDPARLDFDQRTKLRLAKALAGEPLPYAMLIYVWSSNVTLETVVPHPQIDRIRMLVVDSGAGHLGSWVSFRRDVLEDYRRVFGEEPDDIVAVGVLTDSDSTRQTAHALYGDITFLAR